MGELVTALVYCIGKFVNMFFQMRVDSEIDVSLGSFLLAVAILGALIRLIFSLVKVPGSKWIAGYQDIKDRGKED